MVSSSSEKYAIVTGVSIGGIGYYTTKGLAQRGYHVTLACRTQKKAEAAIDQLASEGVNKSLLTFKQLDVGELKSVKKFADDYKKDNKPLSVLICNAGIYKGGKTSDGIDAVFATNYLGHLALTEMLTPLLIKNKPARVINVASLFHRFGNSDYETASKTGRMSAYGDSKLYTILAGRELHRKLRSQGVSVYNVHPGAVSSGFYGFVGPTAEKYVKMVIGTWFLTPEQGAATTLSCVFDQPQNEQGEAIYVSPHRHLPVVGPLMSELLGSKYTVRVSILPVSAAASDDAAGKRLVEFSDQLIKNKIGSYL